MNNHDSISIALDNKFNTACNASNDFELQREKQDQWIKYLSGKRIAIVRYDVMTRGSDRMADIIAKRIRQSGARVDIYYARGRYNTCYQFDLSFYYALYCRYPVTVAIELIFHQWRKYDYIISDFLPLLFCIGLRHRHRTIYFAQNYDLYYYSNRVKRSILYWMYRRVLQSWKIPVMCTSKQLAETYYRDLQISPIIIQEGEWARLYDWTLHSATICPPNRSRKYLLISINGQSFAKGSDILIKVLQRLDQLLQHDLEVWLVGCKTSWQPKKSILHQFGVVTENALRGMYNASDIFLFTSRYENFPSPPFEAMTCGCPVVSTPVAEYLIPNSNAIVSPPDPLELAQSVMNVITNRKLKSRLRNGGKTTVAWVEKNISLLPTAELDFVHCIKQIEGHFRNA